MPQLKKTFLLLFTLFIHLDYTIRYLFVKHESQSRLLRWILLMQKFNLEIKDKERYENNVPYHLSRLNQVEETEEERLIR